MFQYQQLALWLTTVFCFINCMDTNQENEAATHDKLLSRKRRYIVFPEGSSFQLVYCLTVPAYAAAGGIFTLGVTASLAWELPHDPYAVFRKSADAIHRRKDEQKLPHSNKPKNPEYSPKPQSYYKKSPVKTSYFKPMYNYRNEAPFYQKNTGYTTGAEYSAPRDPVVNYYYDQNPYGYHVIHRRTRRDLYLKLEKFFNAQRKDGRACVLKALCEISQASRTEKGTFVEAIMRTIFTWKPDPETTDSHYYAYNKAATHLEDCSKLYPSCSSSVFGIFQ